MNDPFPSIFPPSLLGDAAARLLGFDALRESYGRLRVTGEGTLAERLLGLLHVTYSAAPRDLEHIPREGAAVVVANHPFGILEAAVLLTLLRNVRPDVRVLANELLCRIPELRDTLIPVDTLTGSARTNASGARQALRFLASGGLLLAFPAGAVSYFHYRDRGSRDPAWNPHVSRLISMAARAGTPLQVVPAFVPGSNSLLFHAAGMIHSRFRTALLAHELFNKRGASVEVRFGRPVAPARLLAMESDVERIQYLRWRTYLLADRPAFKPNTRRPLRHGSPRAHADIAAAVPPAVLAAEIGRLPANARLDQTGDLEVYLAGRTSIPNVLREIGRLREVTFRSAGEGTGRALDLDHFDDHYLHLFVWDAKRRAVAGAYRLQGTDRVSELYTQTLFRFGERFLAATGPALELGRSFIRAEYQKGFAPLLLLWKGIGKYVARNPRYKILFGPVSISNRYQTASRELMIAFLEARAGLPEWHGLVRARNAPPRPRGTVLCGDVDELSDIVADLEPGQAGVPVLLRQYLRLGGRLLGFNVDPEFSNALDGLIVVDLTRTERKLVERYLGREEAAQFLAFHRRESL